MKKLLNLLQKSLLKTKKVDKWDGSLPKVSGEQNSIIKLD
jgi:hypothetical protein